MKLILLILIGVVGVFSFVYFKSRKSTDDTPEVSDASLVNYSRLDNHSELFKVASEVVNLPANIDSMSMIDNYYGSFFQSGEEIESTWARFSKKHDFPTLTEVWEDDAVYIVYKGQKHNLGFVHDPSDQIRGFIELNKAICADYEVRYCIDYVECSDIVFMVMTHQDWAELSEKFGQDKVELRFLELPDNYDDFTNILDNDIELKGYKQ